ncbi:alpha/beta fold hydrolase [Rhodococcus chondri]|uniref:Alpha/beta hydrolase n=1 Tax=Rhodococcus chondri TaxID=3065941 RepID=A0ABU7JPV9_9NOCA|nr:alpha/beta hydrolase [Rhodococcus sp. CC-R104]MEE2032058.1 alpha/beta hydrolase [Rhodococcus sp. CC-R104]
MKKPSGRTSLLVVGVIVLVGAAIGVAASRRRRRRTVVHTKGAAPHELLTEPAAEAETIEITAGDGAKLHVRAYGDPDAPPLVFSHGWTCSAAYWTPQINAFADDYRVVVYDQRGHGDSDAGSRKLGADVLADDLAAVLDATVPAGRRAVLAGHSMGGMSIIAWAEKYPEQVNEKVAGVLLASTGTDSLVAHSAVIPLPQRFPRVPVPVARPLMGATVPLAPSRVTTRALRYIALSPSATTEEVAFCEKIVLGCPPRTRGGWGAALSAIDIREGLANLTVPTTVLVGTADRLTPPVHAHRLAAGLEDAGNLERLVVLEGVGHMSSVEAIDRVNDELRHLLEGADAPAHSKAG